MSKFRDIIEYFPPITPRGSDSVIVRFLDAFSTEAEDFGDDLDEIRESHYVDVASGDALDRIGAQYGPLGRRAGRDDSAYRTYLKSLVQVFQYRGTVPGIIAATSAGLGIRERYVDVYEHFNDPESEIATPKERREYTITLSEWTPHRVSTIEQLANLSDASTSDLRKIRYDAATEETGVADSISVVASEIIEEIVAADDLTAIDTNKLQLVEVFATSESIVATEGDPNDSTWQQDDWGFAQWSQFVEIINDFPEVIGIKEETVLNTYNPKINEQNSFSDEKNVSVSTNNIHWEEDLWGGMQWTAQNVSQNDVDWDEESWGEMDWTKENI